ncbi:hypothetical protein V6N12_022060 [Hibiscus sabdariffa]|uniref:Uncharacterized protein n=1 Tax=Hibiscus sabdariffa TaxID=183260 RepID=A0ABR2FTJ0_9ROSI
MVDRNHGICSVALPLPDGKVPFLDATNTLLNPILALTVAGYEEFGYPGMLTNKKAFRYHYLLILDRTNWRTNMLTSLLVPYIFFSLPSGLLDFLRGDVGKWIAFIAVVLRLFFPRHFPDWLEMPGSLILLLVVAPNFFAVTLKDNLVGVFICLLIGCYLLQEHIRASGVVIHERKKIFKRNGSSLETIGLIPVKDLARSESFWPKIMQDKLLPGVSSYLRKPIMYEADVIMRGRANMKLNENSRIRQSVYRATIDGKLLAIKKTKEDIYYKGTEDFAESKSCKSGEVNGCLS